MQSARPDRATPTARASYAVIATFACLACTFFLIAATIVLALIPIYTAQQSVSVNTNAQRSKPTQMLLSLDSGSGRRKRDDFGNGDLDGYSLDGDGNSAIASFLGSKMPPYVQSVSVSSATIIPTPSSSRRRRGLSKRARGTRSFLLIVVLLFDPVCPTGCQKTNGAPLRAVFLSLPYLSFGRRSMRFIKDGAVPRFVPVALDSCQSMAPILPGAGSETPAPIVTTTTTTAATVTSQLTG